MRAVLRQAVCGRGQPAAKFLHQGVDTSCGCDYVRAFARPVRVCGSGQAIFWIDSEAPPGRLGEWPRFHGERGGASRTGHCGWFAPALFDKLIEERETQAAESWRIHEARKRLADRTDSGDLCVSAITKAYMIRGNPSCMRRV